MKTTVDRLAALLNTSDGKDKVLRTICYALQFVADKSADESRKTRLFGIAAQLSSARLVLRQLGDIPMLKYTWDHFKKGPEVNSRLKNSSSLKLGRKVCLEFYNFSHS